MAKRKVKITTEPTENADIAALNSQYETVEGTVKEDKYQGSTDVMSSLNTLIKTGNVHLNDIDMQEFLKADDSGKQAMLSALQSKAKKRKVNLSSIGNETTGM